MSAERVVRSKGSASQPNKIVIIGVTIKTCDFNDIFGKFSLRRNFMHIPFAHDDQHCSAHERHPPVSILFLMI